MPLMLGDIDHVGYLARDLDQAIEQFTERLGLPVVRRFERPQFNLLGAYLGTGGGSVEVFAFTDPGLSEQRLGGAEVLLDHLAYAVTDIEAISARMRRAGVRFSGPDLRGELHEPVELGGVRHLWTVPETSWGSSLQLLERPRP